MNVRLGYSATFTAGVYFESGVVMNTYSADFQLITKTDNTVDQNIAMERLKYIVYEQFGDSILFGAEDKKHTTGYQSLGFRTIVMPEQAADQIIGLALFEKLNSVMEDNIEVIDISIRSGLGGGVNYLHAEGEHNGPFENAGWWKDSGPMCVDKENKKKKVVSLNDTTWKSLDLEWGSDEEEIVVEIKLEKQPEQVDKSSENVVEFKPNDKK